MEQIFLQESVSVLHELDLGQHTLFLMSDGSMDLLTNDEHTPYLQDKGLRLDNVEVYRLFISLQEQFQQGEGHGYQEQQLEKIKGGDTELTPCSSQEVSEREHTRPIR